MLECFLVFQSTVQTFLWVSVAYRRIPIQEDLDDLHEIEWLSLSQGWRPTSCSTADWLGSSWKWRCCGLMVAVFTCTSHVLIRDLFYCLTQSDDQLKYVSERHNARKTASISSVPNQWKRGRLLNDHGLNALFQSQLVVEHDDLRIVWERLNYLVLRQEVHHCFFERLGAHACFILAWRWRTYAGCVA